MTTEERLERLERELGRAKRHNRWLLAGVALCLGIVLIARASGPPKAAAQPAGAASKVVHANGFVLEDRKGKTRAKLVMSKGRPGLALYDEKGKTRAGMSVSKDGPGFFLADEGGKLRAAMDLMKGGAPRLFLKDEKGTARAILALFEGESSLHLTDEKGNIRALLNEGKLVCCDEKGQVIWSTP